MEDNEKKSISSYNDLIVFKDTYRNAIIINKEVLLKIPAIEKFDLIDQLRRSSKAIPRLIAEGYAKRHQKRGFQKYLDDAMAESNETVVSLCQCRDIYNIDCEELIKAYEISGRQLYRLSEAWSKFGQG